MLYNGISCQIVNFWHKTTNLASKLIYIEFPDDLNRFEDDAMYLHRLGQKLGIWHYFDHREYGMYVSMYISIQKVC